VPFGPALAVVVEEMLAPERFPLLHAMRDEILGGDQEERFELGLDVTVAGLAAFAERDTAPAQG